MPLKPPKIIQILSRFDSKNHQTWTDKIGEGITIRYSFNYMEFIEKIIQEDGKKPYSYKASNVVSLSTQLKEAAQYAIDQLMHIANINLIEDNQTPDLVFCQGKVTTNLTTFNAKTILDTKSNKIVKAIVLANTEVIDQLIHLSNNNFNGKEVEEYIRANWASRFMHELMHVLGIDGHTHSAKSLMGTGHLLGRMHKTFGPDDIELIRYYFGSRTCPSTPTPNTYLFDDKETILNRASHSGFKTTIFDACGNTSLTIKSHDVPDVLVNLDYKNAYCFNLRHYSICIMEKIKITYFNAEVAALTIIDGQHNTEYDIANSNSTYLLLSSNFGNDTLVGFDPKKCTLGFDGSIRYWLKDLNFTNTENSTLLTVPGQGQILFQNKLLTQEECYSIVNTTLGNTTFLHHDPCSALATSMDNFDDNLPMNFLWLTADVMINSSLAILSKKISIHVPSSNTKTAVQLLSFAYVIVSGNYLSKGAAFITTSLCNYMGVSNENTIAASHAASAAVKAVESLTPWGLTKTVATSGFTFAGNKCVFWLGKKLFGTDINEQNVQSMQPGGSSSI